MMMEMGLVAMAGESPWGPPRMIAAIVMGEGVPPLPPPPTFDLMVLMVAMAVHFMLSVLLGLAFAIVARRFGLVMAVATGAALGLGLSVVNLATAKVHFSARS